MMLFCSVVCVYQLLISYLNVGRIAAIVYVFLLVPAAICVCLFCYPSLRNDRQTSISATG